MNDFNIQNAYLFGCLNVKLKCRSTKGQNVESRRSHTIYYQVQTTDQAKKEVCEKAFLNIHGLQKSRGRIENIVKSIKKGCHTQVGWKRKT
nr:unnamed protein product [Callosobruchus chinensis]